MNSRELAARWRRPIARLSYAEAAYEGRAAEWIAWHALHVPKGDR